MSAPLFPALLTAAAAAAASDVRLPQPPPPSSAPPAAFDFPIPAPAFRLPRLVPRTLSVPAPESKRRVEEKKGEVKQTAPLPLDDGASPSKSTKRKQQSDPVAHAEPAPSAGSRPAKRKKAPIAVEPAVTRSGVASVAAALQSLSRPLPHPAPAAAPAPTPAPAPVPGPVRQPRAAPEPLPQPPAILRNREEEERKDGDPDDRRARSDVGTLRSRARANRASQPSARGKKKADLVAEHGAESDALLNLPVTFDHLYKRHTGTKPAKGKGDSRGPSSVSALKAARYRFVLLQTATPYALTTGAGWNIHLLARGTAKWPAPFVADPSSFTLLPWGEGPFSADELVSATLYLRRHNIRPRATYEGFADTEAWAYSEVLSSSPEAWVYDLIAQYDHASTASIGGAVVDREFALFQDFAAVLCRALRERYSPKRRAKGCCSAAITADCGMVSACMDECLKCFASLTYAVNAAMAVYYLARCRFDMADPHNPIGEAITPFSFALHTIYEMVRIEWPKAAHSQFEHWCGAVALHAIARMLPNMSTSVREGMLQSARLGSNEIGLARFNVQAAQLQPFDAPEFELPLPVDGDDREDNDALHIPTADETLEMWARASNA